MARVPLFEQTLIAKQTVDQDIFFSSKQNSSPCNQEWCWMSPRNNLLLRAVQVVDLGIL